MASEGVCRYCDKDIRRVRHGVEGIFPKFMWRSEGGFYCPTARGECRHEPKAKQQPEVLATREESEA